jgi:NADP-dependent 3-hydroxy acid dehydrogenase YdfG
MMNNNRKAIIVGASSGMGFEISRLLLADGWSIGVAARRLDRLEKIKCNDRQIVLAESIDVTGADASEKLLGLIERLGGMDLYIHVSGVGRQNMQLESFIEENTVMTNSLGFTRMVCTAFNWMAVHGGGHIAVISSIAGTKGLGAAPSYSATKAFQNTYIEALEQLSAMRRLGITFTDIRPGFVNTDLLNGDRKYPMLMDKSETARNIVKAIYRRKHVKVIDWKYTVLTALWKCIPRWIWRNLNVK